ncbi:MAG: lysophospholipid acyltransferase family protein [Desulfovibrionaceae bacterium]
MHLDLARLAPAAAALFRLWGRSLRYDDAGQWAKVQAMRATGRPCCLALWHSELFALTAWGMRKTEPFITVVSQSRDGEFIARILERLGHATARGSSTRGGVRALLTVKRRMEREGRIGIFTVDGPRGPRHEVKDGILFAAQRAGAAIFPVRAFPAGKWVFAKSWDRFEAPYPFTRCAVRVGTPLILPEGELDENARAEARQRLASALESLSPESGAA